MDKIQIIDKFVENKLLKGIQRSTDKVINIKLKADRKKLLFGNATAGVGNDDRTNDALNLLSFYKKWKSLTFVNFNNIGKPSTSERSLGNIFGTYSYNKTLPRIADIRTGYILTDYRSFQRGGDVFIPANSHTGILSYNFRNLENNTDFLANFNVIGAISKPGYLSNVSVFSDFNLTTKTPSDFNSNSLFVSAGLERFFPFISSRVKLKTTVSEQSYENTLNNSDLRRTDAFYASYDLSVRSGFLHWFNYHLGATLKNSNALTTFTGGTQKTYSRSLGAFLDIHLRFSTRFFAKLEDEYFYFKQSSSDPHSYNFLNGSAQYDLIPNKLTVSLSARNLFNTTDFVNSSVTDYSLSVNSIRLIPRFILFEGTLRF